MKKIFSLQIIHIYKIGTFDDTIEYYRDNCKDLRLFYLIYIFFQAPKLMVNHNHRHSQNIPFYTTFFLGESPEPVGMKDKQRRNFRHCQRHLLIIRFTMEMLTLSFHLSLLIIIFVLFCFTVYLLRERLT